eukprot:3848399-Pleurochrysis_carterae.AAC.1
MDVHWDLISLMDPISKRTTSGVSGTARRIGLKEFALVEPIGSGGYGTVWLARRCAHAHAYARAYAHAYARAYAHAYARAHALGTRARACAHAPTPMPTLAPCCSSLQEAHLRPRRNQGEPQYGRKCM